MALGYAILPRDSRTYWADRLFLNADRIVFLGTRGNQSLRGIVTRLAGSVNSGTTPWIILANAAPVRGVRGGVPPEGQRIHVANDTPRHRNTASSSG